MNNCPHCRGTSAMAWPAAKVWVCRECELMFRDPMPDAEALRALYEESWSCPDSNTSETGSTGLALARVYADRLAAPLERHDFRGMRILEIGAGSGSMAAALAERGAEVCAVEPFGFESLQKQGVSVYRDVSEIEAGAHFDGIIALQVIEHLPEPWTELSRWRSLLKAEQGWLWLSTPNRSGLNGLLRKDQWREVKKSGHLYLFNSQSLDHMLARCGFGRRQRLRFFHGYGEKIPGALCHYALQFARLDGELQYLSFR